MRKRLVEVQYLRTTISDEQRKNSAGWSKIPFAGSRRPSSSRTAAFAFPQNPCSSCPYLGLCLGKQQIVDRNSGSASRSRKSWLA